MDIGTLYLVAVGVVVSIMILTFVIAQLKRDNSIIDIAWGFGFAAVAATTYFVSDSPTIAGSLITLLTIIWGLRLAAHIYLRKRGKPEDFRYATWRKRWGKWFLLRSLLQIYALQGVLMLVIASSIIVANAAAEGAPTLLVILGVLVWLAGFGCEVTADLQLEQFTQNPNNRGNVLRSGLWRYSRHPNYFGEALLWWGIWLIAVGLPFGLLALISPLVITVLLRFVSGVPLLERRYQGNAAYAAYAAATSTFIPRPPRRPRTERRA